MNRGFDCNDCGLHFTVKGRYRQHLKSARHVKSVEKKNFRCDICEVRFTNGRDFIKHQRDWTHLQKVRQVVALISENGNSTANQPSTTQSSSPTRYVCLICDENFPNAKAVSDHENTNKHKRRCNDHPGSLHTRELWTNITCTLN